MNGFARHSNRRTGWLSRNRWGLGLMPLATVLALAASSDRVKTYWWEADLHDPVVAEQGEWMEYSQPYELDDGEHVMSLRVRLDSVRTMTDAEVSAGSLGTELPEGTRAVQVTLSVAADPGMPVAGCQGQLRGDDGTRYAYQQSLVGEIEAGSVCVPVSTPGPLTTFGKLEMPGPDEEPRPPEYSVKRAWVIPKDAVVNQFDLWWETPEYIAFRAGS